MAITHAVQQGRYLKVYDGSRELFSKYIDTAPKGDGLLGFTSSSVTVKIGAYTETYDEKGKKIGSKYIGN